MPSEIVLSGELAERTRKLQDALETGFRVAGEELAAIHEKRLYETAYSSFDEYCRHHLPVSRRYAYRLIDFGKISQMFVANGHKIYPDLKEGVARELMPVADTPELAHEAMLKASEGGVTPTAGTVRKAVRRLLETLEPAPGLEPPPEPVEAAPAEPLIDQAELDAHQRDRDARCRLPDDCPPDVELAAGTIDVLLARTQIEEMMREIGTIRRQLKGIQQEDVAAYLHVQEVDVLLKNAWRSLNWSRPWGPCMHSTHAAKTGCRACTPVGAKRALGWLDRTRWSMAPDKLKEWLAKRGKAK